jgi:flagellar motor switch protein FliM
VQIVPPNEVVVVIGFEVKMANRAGTMNLCIPYAVIEPLMNDLAAQSWFSTGKVKGSSEYEKRLKGQLSGASLEVTGILAETSITVRDLFNLGVGDIITTERSAQDPVEICVEGERKLLATMGQFKGARALKIVRPITESDRN